MYDLACCLRPHKDASAGSRLGGAPPPPSSEVATIAAAALECGNTVSNILDPSDERSLVLALQMTLQFFRSAALPASHATDPLHPSYTPGMGVLSPVAAVQQVTAVGHCHIDTAWLWPYRETRRKIVRSWSTQLRYMARYPGLPFTFAASQAVQYDWLREDHPELMPALEAAVAAHRFIPVGGSWVEPDANMPSGEALARQFLLGERKLAEMFGEAGRSTVFWLPDTFGYSAQLPQIARLCGKPYFLTQKLSWSLVNRPRHSSFWWAGLDGTRVLVHFPPADTYNAQGNVQDVLRSATQNKSARDAPQSLMLYGNGDGGGGPTIEMLLQLARMMGSRAQNRHAASAEGAGQMTHNPSDLAVSSAEPDTTVPARLQGLPAVRHGDPHAFFTRLERTAAARKLHKHTGELYLELHQGTLTTKAGLKLGNRVSERLLGQVEFLGVAAALAATQLAGGHSATLPITSTIDITSAGSQLRTTSDHDAVSGAGAPPSTPQSSAHKAAKADAVSTPASSVRSSASAKRTGSASSAQLLDVAFQAVGTPRQLPRPTGCVLPSKATLQEYSERVAADMDAALSNAWQMLGSPSAVLRCVRGLEAAPEEAPPTLQKLKLTLPTPALSQMVKLVRKNDKRNRLLARQAVMFRVLASVLASKPAAAVKKPFVVPGSKKRQLFAGKVEHALESNASATLPMWHPDYILLHVKYADGDEEDANVNEVQRFMSPPFTEQELGWAKNIVVAIQSAAFKIIDAAIAWVEGQAPPEAALPPPTPPSQSDAPPSSKVTAGSSKKTAKSSKKRPRSSDAVASVMSTATASAPQAETSWQAAMDPQAQDSVKALLQLAENEASACTLPYAAVGGFRSGATSRGEDQPSQLQGPAGVYPELALRKLWQGVCLNQFHDVLPGSSIGMAHDDALLLYQHIVGRAVGMRREIAGALAAMLTLPGTATYRSKLPRGMRVWNASSVPQLALVHQDSSAPPRLVRKPSSMRLPVPVPPLTGPAKLATQAEQSATFKALATLLGPAASSAGAVVAPLPSWGGCDVAPRVTLKQQLPHTFHVTAQHTDKGIVLSNAFLAVCICTSTGHVTSLQAKAPPTGHGPVAPQEVLPLGGCANQLTLHRDIPLFWDAWDTFPWTDEAWLDVSTGRHVTGAGDAVAAAAVAAAAAAQGTPMEEPTSSAGHLLTTDLLSLEASPAAKRPGVSVKLVTGDPLQAAVEVQITLPGHRSFLFQRIVLDAMSPTVSFDTAVLWRETHAILRVGFPVATGSTSAEYDSAWGSVTRPLHSSSTDAEMQQEVTGHSYACMAQENLAVALLNDCKYGYNCMPGVMRLSLLRASQAPDKNADCAQHVFKYGVTVATPGIRSMLSQLWQAVCASAQCPVPLAAACGAGSLRDLIVAQAKQFNAPPFEVGALDNRLKTALMPFELFSVRPSVAHSLSCTSVLLDGIKMAETPLQPTFKCSALKPATGLFEAAAPRGVPCFVLRLYESTGQSGWCTVHSCVPLASVTAVNLLEQPFGGVGDVSYSGYEQGADHASVAAAARRVGDAASGMQHRGPMPPVVSLQADGKSLHVFVTAHQVVSIKCVVKQEEAP